MADRCMVCVTVVLFLVLVLLPPTTHAGGATPRGTWVLRPPYEVVVGVPFTAILSLVDSSARPFVQSPSSTRLRCSIASKDSSVALSGVTKVASTQSACVFQGVALASVSPLAAKVSLVACAVNNSLYPIACNTSTVNIAQCTPRPTPFNISNAAQVAIPNSPVSFIVEGYFPWIHRRVVRCYLSSTSTGAATTTNVVDGLWLDTCRTQCTFPSTDIDVNGTFGYVTISINGRVATSGCPGSSVFVANTVNNAQRRSVCSTTARDRVNLGCPVVVTGPSTRVAFSTYTVESFATPGQLTQSQTLAGAIDFGVCDGAGNAVTDKSGLVGQVTSTFANYSVLANAPAGLQLSIVNATIPYVDPTRFAYANDAAKTCTVNATGGVPLLVQPSGLMGWTPPASSTATIKIGSPLPCVSTSPGIAVTVRFTNSSAQRRTADTLAPYVASISGFDKFGHSVTGPSAVNVTVAVEVASRDANGNVVRSASPLVFTQSTSTFPTLVSIHFPTNATNVTLLTYLTDTSQQQASVADELPGVMVVRYCSPSFASVSGIDSVTASYSAVRMCGRRANLTLPYLMVSPSQPTLNIKGALFDYDTPAYCHFSTLDSPWSPDTVGFPATVVSSCEMTCVVDAVSLPVRHAMGTTAVPSSSSSGLQVASILNLGDPVGQLRIRQDEGPWSNSVDMDVVGNAYTLAITSWSQDLYPRRATTLLAPITLDVVDILGSSRLNVDDTSRLVQLYSPPLAQQQLNATGVTQAYTRTCSSTPGRATFSDLLLFDPEQGDYGLYFSADALVTSSAILHIRSLSVDYDHFLGLVSGYPIPKSYINVSSDTTINGLLPVQPVIGIYKQGVANVAPDGDVSDVNCIATVLPLDPTESIDTVRGLGLKTKSSSFGNFVSFSLGVATFKTLRFVGTAGKSYRITFFLENTTAKVGTFQLVVYTPVCPSPHPIATIGLSLVSIASLPNSSLVASDSIVLKGWTFSIPKSASSYLCVVGNATLPATFVDMCTVKCFTPEPGEAIPAAVTLCPSSNSNCCYDTNLNMTRCSRPEQLQLQLVLPNANAADGSSTTADVGGFTFLGSPTAIEVVPNVQSPWTLPGTNQQVLLSANLSQVHTVIVSFIDALGNSVGRFDGAATRPVAVTAIQRRAFPVLSVPSNRSAIQQRLGTSFVPTGSPYSCFPMLTQNATLDGTLVMPSVNGTVEFSNISIVSPIAGTYDLSFAAYSPVDAWPPLPGWNSSDKLQFATTVTVHVLPGVPAQACLVSDMTSTTVTNVDPLVPQPVLMLLDSVGNLVQPLARDNLLVSSGISTLVNLEGRIQTLGITAALYGRPYDYVAQNASGPFSLVSASLTSENAVSAPSADYLEATDVTLVQFAFKQLTPVRTKFGAEYVIRFHVTSLSADRDVFTPLMLHRQCDTTEYGTVGTDTCTSCPSGLSHCVGGSTAKCFTCNGSTGLNVTDGYWRDVPASTVAYACNTGGVCLGNTELGTCGQGYLNHRPLCAVCETGNAHDILGACVNCAPAWVSIIVLAVFALAAAVVLGILIMATVKEDGNQDDGDQSLVGLLKIFVNFVQVTGMLGEFQVNFPSYVLTYFNIVAASSGGSGISISPVNCLFPNLTYLDKLVIQLVMPPVLLIGLAGVLLFRGYRKKSRLPIGSPERAKAKIFNWNLFVTSAVVLLFIIYQTIVTQCIDTFACIELDTGVLGQQTIKVLRQDARVNCRDIDYERHVAVAMYGLFLYGAVLPLTGMILVLRTARTQGWFAANGTFSFLIRGFRLRLWFWEFVIVFRKVLIRVLLSAVKDATLQALLGIWTLTGLFLLHAFAHPYVKAMHNRAEGLGLLTLVVTLNIGLLFRGAQLTTGDVCGPTCAIVVIVLIAFNLIVIGYFIYSICRALLEHIIEMFGVDNVEGKREVSRRNVKRVILGLLQQQKRQAPNFKTYTPPFLNRELAVSLLGETTVTEVEEVLNQNAAQELDQMDFTLVGGKDDDAAEFQVTVKKSKKQRGGDLDDGDDSAGSRDSDEESEDADSEEDETMAIAETDALLDAIFDPIDVPDAPDELTNPKPREAPKPAVISPPRRKLEHIEDLPVVAVETVVDVAESAMDAAQKAKIAATDAARLARDQARLAASFAVDRASDAAQSAVVRAKGMAQDAAQAADRVKDTTTDLVRTMHQGVTSATRRVQQQAGKLLRTPSTPRASGSFESDPSSPVVPLHEATAEEREDLNEAMEVVEDLDEARRRRRRRSRKSSRTQKAEASHSAADDGDDDKDRVADLLSKLNAAGMPT